MNGVEFRALLAAAGLRAPATAADYLNVVPAADYLEVANITLWRWCYDAAPVPAWAVDRLRGRVAELAGSPPESGRQGSP